MVYNSILPYRFGWGARQCLTHTSEAMTSLGPWVNDGEWQTFWGIELLFLIPTKQEIEHKEKQMIFYSLACSRSPEFRMMGIDESTVSPLWLSSGCM